MDAETIGKDNCCQLGVWLYGEGKLKYSAKPEFGAIIQKHKAFHAEAGKIARLINSNQYGWRKRRWALARRILCVSGRWRWARHHRVQAAPVGATRRSPHGFGAASCFNNGHSLNRYAESQEHPFQLRRMRIGAVHFIPRLCRRLVRRLVHRCDHFAHQGVEFFSGVGIDPRAIGIGTRRARVDVAPDLGIDPEARQQRRQRHWIRRAPRGGDEEAGVVMAGRLAVVCWRTCRHRCRIAS